ncbi:UDP-N-acetylmuramoyl-tripeptide--D-alanyl-D-alanine ligase [Nocardioides zeae]|uniref:UDP-N-acetylmuramoyl-tripeptide--D-alanyl-D-alanine ligase n=1 Tax=Nocardioides imazamoxiresistens TaxID=3231893 RepID=A0ABU3PZ43_9ACTN|nr:UDP-N-acetylmuramoyl-tripeptide--D-alanyl-D-alanine ligase [Nocardioides zeae]MDT9594505.1 UDP-N-acetylmuramoyl-tripeptide--D-alanyl-D-alanine ligase [Nocardioides zeae]
MIPLTLAEIAAAVGGTVDGTAGDGDGSGGDVVVDGVATLDSRDVAPGGLFVAVPGEHVDGHDYAQRAVATGAAAVLAQRPVGVPAVLVPDTTVALGRLARAVLERVDAGVVALTGSQGKTGVKDYLAQVLAADAPTVATLANHNNELGVPLTVLQADADTRHLVVEMGARGVGHIAYLCDIAPPRVAAVLNVGTAHVGEFGSVDNIARAKGEIVEALPADGHAVLNADDPRVAAMRPRTAAPVLTFGEAGDVSWRGLELDALGRPSVELGYAGAWAPLRLAASGAHQVPNAAAAAALALCRGLDFETVVEALSAARPASRWRMEVTERADGLVVVNDAYNANPASMRAAIDALVAMAAGRPGRAVAVLGEMRELGAGADEEHERLGRAVAQAGVDVLVAVGGAEGAGAAGRIAAGARAAGDVETVVTPTRDEALAWLGDNVSAHDVVLVKASRGVALEVVADGLLGAAAGAAATGATGEAGRAGEGGPTT